MRKAQEYLRGHGKGKALTPEQVHILLEHDLHETELQAIAMFGGSKEFAKLPPAVQEVVVDLAFNMGTMGLRGFPQFIKDIKAHHWKHAAQDIKYKDRANTQKGKSKYYTTLKSRAKKKHKQTYEAL